MIRLIVFGLIALILVIAVWSLLAPYLRSVLAGEDSAVRTLRKRYADGEISSREYQERLTVLKGDSYHPENFD